MNITDFLKTGRYLDLAVGLSEHNLYSILPKKSLGKKHYYNSDNHNKGFSYFYQALEVMIIDSKIYSLGFDITSCPVTLLNDQVINAKSSFEFILKCLDIVDIEWNFEQQYCNNRELTIKTAGNVLCGCVHDKGDYWLTQFKVFK
ncbi:MULTISPECIES: hypothetical protein [unclassified Gilliamella]|uniref:hypothetical protein n=1 Tax=unclassified Gilliamella TaxID=2685620 RepID=UPI00226AD478|nr:MULTISPECIES: hypothetical protein [unclassified Gilliamella]MCX8641750.1 hypothetical protein [Gilliamella sp. B3835]MCX8706551.1 hypothetical protein [Gilliamella sp. B3783]MCX8708979.1 hypothetical protein [Gilliamella sp. B3780]MCX8714479.1 hypothetical protein [Gilliamella sp. B3781]MCX8715845.1 hypothetical protein [Gilliamella sp. B3784]